MENEPKVRDSVWFFWEVRWFNNQFWNPNLRFGKVWGLELSGSFRVYTHVPKLNIEPPNFPKNQTELQTPLKTELQTSDAVNKIHRTQDTWEKGNDARADSLWLLQVGDSQRVRIDNLRKDIIFGQL